MCRPVAWLPLVLLVLFSLVASSTSSGPDVLTTPPVWNFTMAECGLFRNEAVLRPHFVQWPESIKGVPFRYCCEYQPPSVSNLPTAFNLSGYRYSDDGGSLQPAPYFDLGLIDRKYKWYWKHWDFWKLPTTLYSAPIFCEVTDLHRLYMNRFWTETLVRGVKAASVLSAILLFFGIFIALFLFRRVQWEELFSDLLHVLLLALVGSSLMEAMAHSAIREWRSQLMFNAAVVYTYLTLFTLVSSLVRHCINPKRKHRTDWRWQKVFGQVAALFMVGAYLGLVEDVTGQGLEGVAGIVLGTVIGATIWSAGVEMYIVSQIFSPSAGSASD